MKTISDWQKLFPHLDWRENEPLANHSTVHIGGPAKLFVTIEHTQDLEKVAGICLKEKIPFEILGWGANTLYADTGLDSLVIKNMTNRIIIEPSPDPIQITPLATVPHRYDQTQNKFGAIDYDESQAANIRVDIDSGTPLPYAINHLLEQGVTGFQWYSRIPATLGGAIYNNIHGGTHFISEYLLAVTCLNAAGEKVTYYPSDLDMKYDYSRFHRQQEVILTGHFYLKKGDVKKATETVTAWAKLKAHQPAQSLGCVFANLTPEQVQKSGLPGPSVAYLIDQVLGLKGRRIGNCQISLAHAAFIENLGQGKAKDYLALIKLIRHEAQQKLGITLTPEIFFKGFTPEQLSGIMES